MGRGKGGEKEKKGEGGKEIGGYDTIDFDL